MRQPFVLSACGSIKYHMVAFPLLSFWCLQLFHWRSILFRFKGDRLFFPGYFSPIYIIFNTLLPLSIAIKVCDTIRNCPPPLHFYRFKSIANRNAFEKAHGSSIHRLHIWQFVVLCRYIFQESLWSFYWIWSMRVRFMEIILFMLSQK